MNPDPTHGLDSLAGLRSQAKSATLGRRPLEALDAYKQLVALDPADSDHRKNLQSLILGVNRAIELIEKRFDGIGDFMDEAQRLALIQELDRKVPHWRGFVEEIPRLQSLMKSSTKEDHSGLESSVLKLLERQMAAEALAKWQAAGWPMSIDGKLSSMFRALEELQAAEQDQDFENWKTALKRFHELGKPDEVPLLAHVKPYVERSEWRLKTAGLLARSSSITDEDVKQEAARLVEQMTLAEEELNASPDLANGEQLAERLTAAIENLRSRLKTRPTTAWWVVPLIFVLIVLAALVGAYFLNVPVKVGDGPGSGEPWRPRPSSKAMNPKPLDADVQIPMPAGWGMIFRKVFLPATTPKAGVLPLPSASGTSFVWAPFEEGGRRFFLIGKYEVTRGQYAQFMPISDDLPPEMPVTQVTFAEAEAFGEKFSIWLSGENVPFKSVSGRPARVQLPTAQQWFFAAKNGEASFGSPQFDKVWPWNGPLSEREWLAGPTSSGGRLHAVGTNKEHPLLLFDVYGNAREMAVEQTSPTTQKGAPPIQWMMGGGYGTSENALVASLGIPAPKLMPNENQPFEQEELGFRVVLTAEPDVFQLPETAIQSNH